METFTLGDLVVAKSGGPKMVVYSIGQDDRIDCLWVENDQDRLDTFHVKTLAKAPPTAATQDCR